MIRVNLSLFERRWS